MTKMMKLTLFAIAFFFLAVAASFIWFVATWDPSQEETLTFLDPLRVVLRGGQT